MTRVNDIVQRSPEQAQVRALAAGVYAAAGKGTLPASNWSPRRNWRPTTWRWQSISGGSTWRKASQRQPKQASSALSTKDPKSLVATLGMAATAGARKDAASREVVAQSQWRSPGFGRGATGARTVLPRCEGLRKGQSGHGGAVKKNPEERGARECAWAVLLAARELPGATASFAEAVRLEPTAGDYKLNLARAQYLDRTSRAHSRPSTQHSRQPDESVHWLGSRDEPASWRPGACDGLCRASRQVAPDSPISQPARRRPRVDAEALQGRRWLLRESRSGRKQPQYRSCTVCGRATRRLA